MTSTDAWVYAVIALVSVGITYLWMRLKVEEARRVLQLKIESQYVPKSMLESANEQLQQRELKIEYLIKQATALESDLKHLEERFEHYRSEHELLKEQSKAEFTVLANSILEDNSKKFSALNHEKIEAILSPLKERIQTFEKKIEDTYRDEIKERVSLKKELEQVVRLNQQMSEDASKLTNALLGDKKLQGNWGEVQLEIILERAGLLEGVHYQKEAFLKQESGQGFRPDYIIQLPEDKHLILDAKVSLNAYERYHNEDDELQKKQFLKQHVENIKEHIKRLGPKNYQQLQYVQSPDYVLMFIPLEPALTLALKEDLSLFDKALEKNIVLVSTSTLLATLRTIAFLWKQENQRKNVFEIAKESGALYDKFVGFTEDMQRIGKSLTAADKEYQAAMNKLTSSTKKGDTIVGRIERIKRLGANTTKNLPPELLDNLNESEGNEQ
jgi:DNA recombination protein RmuC